MKAESLERTTGMGATRYTAVAQCGEWVRVSDMPDARNHGRSHGVQHYSVEVSDGQLIADFYRSNSGKESVTLSDGRTFQSFEDAEYAIHRPSAIIVTRHAATVKWLIREIPQLTGAEVIKTATPDDIRGKIVYGNLPLPLASLAEEVVNVEFSGEPPRGREYGVKEMDAAGATLAHYQVRYVS